eukprot:gene7032-biopygen4306
MKLFPWLLPLTAEGRYNASGTSTVSGETHPQLRAILKAVANAPQLSVWRASENSTGFPPVRRVPEPIAGGDGHAGDLPAAQPHQDRG